MKCASSPAKNSKYIIPHYRQSLVLRNQTIPVDVNNILKYIINNLEIIIISHKNMIINKNALTLLRIPQITLFDFLLRIYTYLKMTPNMLIVTYCLMERFLLRLPFHGIHLNVKNKHSIMFMCAYSAMALEIDDVIENKYYCSVGGINMTQFNNFQIVFMNAMDWHLRVTVEEFEVTSSIVMSNI